MSVLLHRGRRVEMNLKEIEKELLKHVDKEYQKGVSMAVPSSWRIIGVRVPEIRKLAAEYAKDMKVEKDYGEVVKFIDDAFKEKIRELALFGFYVLGRLKKYCDEDLLMYAKKWVPLIDDWEVCDVLFYSIIGDMIVKDRLSLKDIMFLKSHKNLFGRRGFIVSLVLPMRKGHGDVDDYLRSLQEFVGVNDRYIVKAMSWVLREGAKSNPDKISAFVEENKKRLHSSIVREVSTKLTKGTKN